MRGRAFLAVAAGLWLASVTARAETSPLRALPWPFAHMVTVASDVDMQPAWYGRALHNRLNDALGIQIGDSFWANATIGAAGTTSLFESIDRVNGTPSGVEGHSVFRLLVRDFHRGHYDHLHGWQSDALPQFRFVLPEPLRLDAEPRRVGLPRVGYFAQIWLSASPQPMSLRLIFDAPPSERAAVSLVGADDVAIPVPQAAMRKGAALQPKPAGEFILEIGLSGHEAAGLMTWRGPPTALMVSDESGSRLLRVEWDNFSRTLVERQAPTLERFNVRPAFLSAHGGYTRAQNLGRRDTYELAPFGDPDFVRYTNWKLRPQGDDPSSAAWHTDILQRIGLIAVAEIPPVDYPYTVLQKHALAPIPTAPFWRFDKTWGISAGAPISREKLDGILAQADPIAAAAGVSRLLCTDNALCLRSEQGRTLGYSIATSLAHVTAGKDSVEHAWYQHFGTALYAPGQPPSAKRPFAPDVEQQLKRLSDHIYDWSGTVPPSRRVWAPAPGVWQIYRISRNNLEKTVSVDPTTSAVSIRSVDDPVLDVKWPRRPHPSRDLAGLTIYTPDSEAAAVFLDGEPFESFTRNPPDATGRSSVTLVNDAFPVTMLGRQSAEFSGVVTLKRFRMAESGRHFIAEGTDPVLTLDPHDLRLHNISHLRLKARKDSGALWIRLVFASGARLAWTEDGARAPDHEARLRLSEKKGTSIHLAPLATLRLTKPIAPEADPPALAGRVARIEIGMTGARPGAELVIEDLSALQSLSHGFAPDGSIVVSGRVLDAAGSPAQDRLVTLEAGGADRRTTRTDAGGYYDFFAVERGQSARIRADIGHGLTCGPMRGSLVWLARDEVELDVSAEKCR